MAIKRVLIFLPYIKIDLKKSSVLSKWKIAKSDRTLDQVVLQPQVVSDADRFPLTMVGTVRKRLIIRFFNKILLGRQYLYCYWVISRLILVIFSKVAVIVATWFFTSLSFHVMTSSATDSRKTNHHLQIFLAIVNCRSIFAVNALQREKSFHNTKITTTTQ